jgi:hypothetical protein
MSDSPYELQRLVTVATFSTPWEAQIARSRLAADGLHALVADEHVIRMVALSNAIGGIQLKVREKDAAAAVEILRHLAPLPDIYLVGSDTAAAAGPEPGAAGAADGGSQDDGDAAGWEPGDLGDPRDWPLATIARFHSPWEAHVAGSLLESEGVRCCVLEERLPAVNLLSAEPTAFNRLEVHQADAARAAEILARAWSTPALVALPDPDSDPEPGA